MPRLALLFKIPFTFGPLLAFTLIYIKLDLLPFIGEPLYRALALPRSIINKVFFLPYLGTGEASSSTEDLEAICS